MKTLETFDQYFVQPGSGERGLTASSASFLAGLASQEVRRLEADIRGAVFYDTKMELLSGEGTPRLIEKGKDEAYLTGLQEKIEHIGRLNGFVAYVHEAVSEKEKRTLFYECLSFDEWLDFSENAEKREAIRKQKDLEKPAMPESESEADFLWAKQQLSIKDLARFLLLEAKASALGKYIHPDGILAVAKDKLSERLSRPVEAEDKGRETTVKTYEASADPERVFTEYHRWQAQQRTWEAELNTLKNKLDLMTKQENLERNRRNRLKLTEHEQALRNFQLLQEQHKTQLQKWQSEFIDFQIEKREAVRNLKIIIPHELQPVYDELAALGR